MISKLKLSILSDKFGICRLNKKGPLPPWAIKNNSFYSITKTLDELSIVCPADKIPFDIKAERIFRVLKVEGPLNFAQTGVISSLAEPLSQAKISIFTISTYNTDYIFIKDEDLGRAIEVLNKNFIIKR